MDRLTAKQLAESPQFFPDGDIAYFGRNLSPEEARFLAREIWQKRLWRSVRSARDFNPERPEQALHLLTSLMGREVELESGELPPWVLRLSSLGRRHFTTIAINQGMFDEHAWLFLSNPGSPMNFGYALREKGLVMDTMSELGLRRLSGVRQLAYLHDPVVRVGKLSGIARRFGHTRFQHVCDVMAIAGLMGHRVLLSDEDLRHLKVAAISHDGRTPAGGDTVKEIDRAAFDEDAHYHELLVGEGWQNLSTRYGLDRNILVDTVLGKGVLGSLLDLSDKQAYLARDSYEFLFHAGEIIGDWEMPGGLTDIWQMFQDDPFTCNIWDKAHVEDGKVVVETEALFRLLLLRAMMFKALYHNPACRFLEHIVSKLVVRYLYRSGRLTRARLLRMRDQELDDIISETVGIDLFPESVSIADPRVAKFTGRIEAKEYAAELMQSGVRIIMMEDMSHTPGTGAKHLVPTPLGPAPFYKAYPRRAKLLKTLLSPPAGEQVRLYWVGDHDFPLTDGLERATRFLSERGLLL